MKKQLFLHYGGYVTSSIGALVGVSLLSYIVPSAMYGMVALYIAMATLFQYIVREALGNALMRHALEIQQNKYIALILIKKACKPIFICYTSVCLFSYFWIDYTSYTELILSYILIFMLGCGVAGEAFLSAVLKRGAFAVHLNIIQWLRFPLGALCFSYFFQSTSSILFGFVLAFIIAAIYDLIVWGKLKQPKETKKKGAKNFCIFQGYIPILIGFFVWFTAFYDRLAIEKLYSEDLLGTYFVLIQVAYMPVIALMHSSANFLFPLLYKQNEKVINSKTIIIVSSILLTSWLFLQLSHQWLFSWLVGEEYRYYSWLVPWLFLAAVINAIAYLFQAKFFQVHTMKTLLLIRGLSALMFFFTVTLLAGLYEIEGLVFANVLTSIFLMMLSYYFGKDEKLTQKQNP
jgi:O-antigen/teichoic acid export membrane protein